MALSRTGAASVRAQYRRLPTVGVGLPAPPQIEKFDGRLRVQSAAQIIASTSRGRRVLETAGAPTYYFPPEDVIAKGIERTGKAFPL